MVSSALAGRDGDATDRGVQLLLGGLLALQVQLHDLFVVLRDGLDQLAAPLLGGLGVRGRDVDDVVHLALGGLGGPHERLHADQVHDALEVGLGTDRQLHDERHGAQAVRDHVHAAVELGTGTVQLVDEADTRNAVAVRLTPHRLGLRLDTGDAVEHRHGTVEHAQRTLHLDGEVDVPRGVDDVDGVVDVLRAASDRWSQRR